MPNNVATTSEAGLMSATDKTKLDGIAAGAQVNPAYATAGFNSAYPTNTDGIYQTGASDSGNYKNSVGTSNTVARGDHKHSLFIANATTSKPGLMSKDDKKKLDTVYGCMKVIYAAAVTASINGAVTKNLEKIAHGVSVDLKFNIGSNKYLEVKTTNMGTFNRIIPMTLTNERSDACWIQADTGLGNFQIHQSNGNSKGVSCFIIMVAW